MLNCKKKKKVSLFHLYCHLASKNVALLFSHDVRKSKELGEKSHSRSRAFQSLEQKGSRERKRDQQKQGRAGIFF